MVKSEAKTSQPPEHAALLLPKAELKKKKWEKRKRKNPIATSLDPEGNPIVPTAVPGGEKSTGTVPVEVRLENPVVDLPKSIEQMVPSNERATTVPIEVGLGNPVVDVAKCVDSIVPTPQPAEHAAALLPKAELKKKKWEKRKRKNPIATSLDPEGNPVVPTAVPGGEKSTGTVPVEVRLENPVVDLPKSIEQMVQSNERAATVPIEVGLGNPVVDVAKCVDSIVPTPQPAEHAAAMLPEAAPKKKRWEKRKKNPNTISLDPDRNPLVPTAVPGGEQNTGAVPVDVGLENPVVDLPKSIEQINTGAVPVDVGLENPVVDLPKSIEQIIPSSIPCKETEITVPVEVGLGNPVVNAAKCDGPTVPSPADAAATPLPKAEPKKKRWEKKKKNPIATSLDPEGNPIVRTAVPGGEKSTGTDPVEVRLENPVVDLPKSIEQMVPSEEKATTVPVEVGLGNPVDVAKCVDSIVPTPQPAEHAAALLREAAPKKKRWEKRKKNPNTISLDPDRNPIVPTAVPGGEQNTGAVPVEVGLENPVVDLPKSIEQIIPSSIPCKETEINVPVEVGLGNPVVNAGKCDGPTIPSPADAAAAPLPEAEPKKKRWEKKKKKNPIATSLDPEGNPIVPTAVPGGEKSTGTVPVEVRLENPVVDLPQSIEQMVPSEEKATTVPVEVGLGNPVVDVAKCVDPIVPTPQPAEHAAALLPEAAPKKKRWKKRKKNPNTISLDPDRNPIVPTAVPGGKQNTGAVPVEVGLENPVVDLPKLIEQIIPSSIPCKETEITVPVEVGLGNPVVNAAKCDGPTVPSPADATATPLPEVELKKKRWEKKKKKNPITVYLDADGNPIVPTAVPVEKSTGTVPVEVGMENTVVDSQKSIEQTVPSEEKAITVPVEVGLGNPVVAAKCVDPIVPTSRLAENAAMLPKAEPKKKRWEKRKRKNPIAVSLDADGNPIVDSQKSVQIKEQALQPEPKPEPIVPTALPVEVGLENTVVDLPKSIEQTVPSNEKATAVPVEMGLRNPVIDAANIEAIVPSKKRKTRVPGLEDPVADAPEAEQMGLIPKPELIVPQTVPSTTTVPVEVGLENPVVDAPKSIEGIVCSPTVPSKKRKRKKSKTTSPVGVGLENAVADAPKSIDVEHSGLVQNPEPIVPIVWSTTRVPVQGGLENPVVDLPKCIEVEQVGVLRKPEPIVPETVSSKKRKRKNSTATTPVEVGLENTVVDAPTPIEVEQAGLVPNPKPIVPLTVPSTTRVPVEVGLENPVVDAPNSIEGIVGIPTVPCKKRKKIKKKNVTATFPVDVGLENPVADAPKPIEGEQAGLIPNPEPVLATVPSKKKKKKKKTNNDTSAIPVDVEAQKYVEICVLCRKKGHGIPTCPELNNLNVNSGGPKKGHGIPTCPELNNLNVNSGGPKLRIKLEKKKKVTLPPMPWGKKKKEQHMKKQIKKCSGKKGKSIVKAGSTSPSQGK